MTPLKKVKNFGPVTLAEFESMGITTREQILSLGFEETCRKWVQYYPERLNANAFIGIICSIEGEVWSKATAAQRRSAHTLVKMLRAEYGLPPRKARGQKQKISSPRARRLR